MRKRWSRERSQSQATDFYSHSDLGELSTYEADANGTSVYSTQYSRDALGRITEKAESVSGESHTYDYNYHLAGRLTEAMTDGTPTAHYDYDANSNRIGGFNQQGSITASYDDQDRMLTSGSATYTYTANGELLTKTDSTGTTTYSYDVLGNLMAVTLPDGTQIGYVLDGKTRRIGKKVNGTLMQGFLYDGQLRIVAELDGASNVVSRFIYGSKPNVPDYMIRGGAMYRIVSDQLGSPRLVVNAADGSVAQRMDYDEFGNVLVDTSPGFQPCGFAGGLYDRDTTLVRSGARDYDPQTGRWTTKDLVGLGPATANLYTYLLNDPLNSADPTGNGVGAFLACSAINVQDAISTINELKDLSDELALIQRQLAIARSHLDDSCQANQDLAAQVIEDLTQRQLQIIARQATDHLKLIVLNGAVELACGVTLPIPGF
ncbi:MAG: RHS repeat domain-containing protein [Candidatus Binatia bacterium]